MAQMPSCASVFKHSFTLMSRIGLVLKSSSQLKHLLHVYSVEWLHDTTVAETVFDRGQLDSISCLCEDGQHFGMTPIALIWAPVTH